MQDKRRGNVLIWIGILALIVIVLLVIFWKPSQPAAPATQPQPQPTYAPQGQVVAGFPQELVLDPNAKVGSSYSINYSASTNQYTAEWASSMSMASLFGKYKTYLSSNGWTITGQSGKATLDSVYATDASGDVANVVISPRATGNEVVVSYVAH
jgi:hypothetical protein